MAQTEELIAIPKSEYEHLKQCEKALIESIERKMQKNENLMQMLRFDTMIKQATPPGIQIKQLYDK